MLVRTLWDPWETASYRNNMLPFSIIIKLHLYKAEAPAALRTSQKVGATNVSLQMAQPQNQLYVSPTDGFRNWPLCCYWFQCPRLWIGCKSHRNVKQSSSRPKIKAKAFLHIPLSAVLRHSYIRGKLQNVFSLSSVHNEIIQVSFIRALKLGLWIRLLTYLHQHPGCEMGTVFLARTLARGFNFCL